MMADHLARPERLQPDAFTLQTFLHEKERCQEPPRICDRAGDLRGFGHRLFFPGPASFGRLAVPARNAASHPLRRSRPPAHCRASRCAGCDNDPVVPDSAPTWEITHVFPDLPFIYKPDLSCRRRVSFWNPGRL